MDRDTQSSPEGRSPVFSLEHIVIPVKAQWRLACTCVARLLPLGPSSRVAV